ncbi:MAG: CBS domain-containing protein [Pirellulaceae bacterium]|nr:CBS domain-containing protein [Planctomycetales bacterium]
MSYVFVGFDNDYTTGLPLMFRSSKSFLRDSQGSASVEYGIVLTVVIAAALAFGSTFTGGAFSGAADALEKGLASSRTNADTIVPVEPLQTAAPSSQLPLYVLLGQSALMLLIAFTMYRTRRRKMLKRQAKQSAEANANSPRFDAPEKRTQLLRVLNNHKSEFSSWEMLVEHAMSSKPPTIGMQATRQQVEKRLTEVPRGWLLVIDKQDALQGVIRADDLEETTGRVAAAIMSPCGATIEHSATLGRAIAKMQEENLEFLPVVKKGRIHGIVSIDELMVSLQCTMQMLREINQEHRRILMGLVAGEPAK